MLTMQTNVALKDYTTMHLGGPAKVLATAHSKEDIVSFTTQAFEQTLPTLVLGEGSNVVVGDKGFAGLVILNRIMGFDSLNEDDYNTIIKISAGENWDSVVKRCVDLNLSGIETLSAIPGCAGAAPIQNIGAYGQEISDTLVELEAYDLLDKKFVILQNIDCDFLYRHSIFNSHARRRYIIISITLKLYKKTLAPPFYASLQKYLDEHGLTDYSPQALRQAVVAIRATRLPSPEQLASCGSFFKNPLIDKWQADELKQNYPNPPLFAMSNNQFKVSAGWLIEQADLKDYASDGIKIYDKNALVLINESATSYKQLAACRDHIIDVVRDMFRITLEQEPEEIGV